MTRRRMDFALALLLPLMVLRAMLPAGYMPVAQDGALRIAMCSDGIYAAATDQNKQQPDGGQHESPSDSGHCLFASSAMSAAPPALTQFIFKFESAEAVVTAPAPTAPASIVRVQSARGPPAISL